MEEIRFDIIIDLFKRNLQLFLKITAATAFIFLLFLAFFEPKYSVNASIIIEEKDDSMNISPEAMLLGGQSQKIANEIEIIKSRKVLDAVINELNLQYVVEKKYNFLFSYYLNLLLGNKTVQGSLNIVKIPQKIQGMDFEIYTEENGFIIEANGTELHCSFDSECSFLDGILLVSKLGDIHNNTRFEVKYRSFIKTREDFSGSLEITPLGDSKSSNVFQAGILTPDPYKTKLVLELLNLKYISTKVSWKSGDADEQQKFVQKMLLDIKKDLDAKSNELAKYQKENQTVLPDLQFTEIMKRNVEVEKEIAILKLQEEIVNKYNDSIDTESLSPVPAPVIIDDLSVQTTVHAHNQLVAKEISLSARFTDNHPEVDKIRSDIKQAKNNLKILLGKTSGNYARSIELLKKQSALIFSTIENLPKNLMNIAALQRDVLITEKLYAFLAQKFYEAGINIEMNMSTIRILDEPTAETRKISPRLSVSALIILVLSLFISFSYIIILEFFRKNVVSAKEICSILRIPHVSINSKDSNQIIRSALGISRLHEKTVKKIAIYSLVPEIESLTGIDEKIIKENILINVVKEATEGKTINEIKTINENEVILCSSGGLNQFFINKAASNLFDSFNGKTSLIFSELGNEIADPSFFNFFDLFIILAHSKKTQVQKLVEIREAIDRSECKTISAIIIDE